MLVLVCDRRASRHHTRWVRPESPQVTAGFPSRVPAGSGPDYLATATRRSDAAMAAAAAPGSGARVMVRLAARGPHARRDQRHIRADLGPDGGNLARRAVFF